MLSLYFSKDVPKINKENSLIDTGVDIIQIDDEKQNIVSLVQCKNGYKNGITMHDLTGFAWWMGLMDKLNGYVYYTDKLGSKFNYLPSNSRYNYIKQPYIDIKDKTKQKIKQIKIKPHNYQLEAKKSFDDNFTNRGIISMPCGTGKTYTLFGSSNPDNKASGLLQSALQVDGVTKISFRIYELYGYRRK